MFSSLRGLAHQCGEPINGRTDQALDVGEQFDSGTSYYFWPTSTTSTPWAVQYT